MCFPGSGKESDCNAGYMGSTPGSGRSPGKKKITTHSSILAWRTPWTEETVGLQSIGLQRVRHNFEFRQQYILRFYSTDSIFLDI